MAEDKGFLPHRVIEERLGGGIIVLRSAYECDPVADTCLNWLEHWAGAAPDRIFLAERQAGAWREITYCAALKDVRALAAALLQQGLSYGDRLAILSGNSVDHGLLALAAQYIGVVVVPVAEQYSLILEAHDRLQYIVSQTSPSMIYVSDRKKYAPALDLPELASIPVLTSCNSADILSFLHLLETKPDGRLEQAHSRIRPDTLAKILFTSGSTSLPKGVETTQRMMCVNQAQITVALPFLKAEPPKILDWLPWNHVFGGSHNFNMMLANGGSLYIDEGKPAKGVFDATLANLADHTGTLAFNVPVGWALLADALEADAALRARFFAGLDLIFYAGASLPPALWARLRGLAKAELGYLPLTISSWGMTETAPATLIVHEPSDEPGAIGVPLPGVEAKLIHESDGRFELRVRGPNIFSAYYQDAEKTEASFDDEGYLRTGDAVRFLDPRNPNAGLVFDGRIAEDFKLMSGTWVQTAKLRTAVLEALGGLAQDVVITGHGRREVGVLIFPNPEYLKTHGLKAVPEDGALIGADLTDAVQTALAKLAANATGSASRITRALVLAEPPSLKNHEVTAKGSLNLARVLEARKQQVERLYENDDPAAILA